MRQNLNHTQIIECVLKHVNFWSALSQKPIDLDRCHGQEMLLSACSSVYTVWLSNFEGGAMPLSLT